MTSTRYYVSSLRRNGKQFANAVRDHWAIENTLHWSLDMTCREDESRVRNRTFADNRNKRIASALGGAIMAEEWGRPNRPRLGSCHAGEQR